MQLRNLNQRYESTSKSRHHWLVFLNPLHRTFFQTDMSNKENASKEKVPGNGKKDRNVFCFQGTSQEEKEKVF